MKRKKVKRRAYSKKDLEALERKKKAEALKREIIRARITFWVQNILGGILVVVGVLGIFQNVFKMNMALSIEFSEAGGAIGAGFAFLRGKNALRTIGKIAVTLYKGDVKRGELEFKEEKER
ncbi:MAG: hypothetical protein NXI08_16485 [bacterium]|nr:hypothetical protein [bacterium]